MKERDEFKAEKVKLQKDAEHRTAVEKLTADLQKPDRFGKMFADAKFAGEAAEMLSSMTDAQREWIMRKFSAVQAQVNFTKLGAEFGQTGTTHAADPVEEFSALIKDKQKEKGFENYGTALHAVRDANPEMAEAYDAAMQKRAGRKGKEE